MRVLDDSSIRGGYSVRLRDTPSSPNCLPTSESMRRGNYDPSMRERLRAALDEMAWLDQGE